MAGKNIKEQTGVLPLTGLDHTILTSHPEIDAEAYRALHHEVTEQFPVEPAAPSKKVEPRKVQQLPPGVKAEDYLALRGEQPA